MQRRALQLLTQHCHLCQRVAQVAPRPVLSMLPLRVPVLEADASTAALEAEYLRCGSARCCPGVCQKKLMDVHIDIICSQRP